MTSSTMPSAPPPTFHTLTFTSPSTGCTVRAWALKTIFVAGDAPDHPDFWDFYAVAEHASSSCACPHGPDAWWLWRELSLSWLDERGRGLCVPDVMERYARRALGMSDSDSDSGDGAGAGARLRGEGGEAGT